MRLGCQLVLASASPRRAAILRQLGLPFELAPADVDERLYPDEAPAAYVERLCVAKAEASRQARGDGAAAYLGADTTVVIDDRVLGKPADAADAARMIGLLRGRWHEVYTAVALLPPGGPARSCTVRSRVHFREFSDETLRAYVASGEGTDKAGAYGVQQLGAGLVDEIRGSYTNVVGLPAAQTLALLEAAGVLESWP